MIKYDYDVAASYTGGVDGLAATSPRKTGKTLKANAAAVKAYTDYTTKLSDKITTRAQKAVPGLKVRFAYAGAYGGVEASIPANQIGALLKTDGVVAVQQDTLQQPLDDNTAFIGATKVWPSLGGSANAGSNVIVGVIDTGVWPEHPMLAPGSLGTAPGGAGLPVRRWLGRGPPGPGLHLQQQAHRRLRQDGHLHGHDRSRRERVLQQHDPPVLRPRLRGPWHAHPDHRRRRLRHVRRPLRRRARPGLRHRSRRARDHVPRLPGRGLRHLRLRVGRPAGHHRRRRRHQLLHLGRRPAVQRRRRARVPRCRPCRDLGQCLRRQLRPGRGDLRPWRTVGDHGRRLDRAARVRLRPPPHRRWRRLARHPRHHPHRGHLEPDPGGDGRRPCRARTPSASRPSPRARRPARSSPASAA